jgi:hypothetical protein
MTDGFQLNYTEPLVRSALNRFWRRAVGWKYFVAVILLALITGSAIERGDRSWYVGVLGTVTVLAVLVSVAGYFAHYRRAMGAFRRLTSGAARFEPTETGFRLESALGYSELSWGAVTQIWRYPDMWLFVFSRNLFSTLPLAAIDAETQSRILSAVRAAGGRIA